VLSDGSMGVLQMQAAFERSKIVLPSTQDSALSTQNSVTEKFNYRSD